MSTKKKVLIAIISFVMVIPLYYSLSYVFTTLPVRSDDEKIDEKSDEKVDATPADFKLYEEWHNKNTWSSEITSAAATDKFPIYSPDGRFYVDTKYLKIINLWVIEMHSSHDNKRIGYFASHGINFYGWCPDSSGIYVRRVGIHSDPGFFISFFNYDFSGPLVVAMVPQKEYKNTVFHGDIITPPNENGWYNTDVTVRFTAISPDVKVLTTHLVINTEGWRQRVTGIAVDREGKEWSYSVPYINIDKTPPEITVKLPEEGALYTLNKTIISKWVASDKISGIANSRASIPYASPIDTSTLGEKIFTAEATDKAGNRTVKTIKYYVISQDEAMLLSPSPKHIWPK